MTNVETLALPGLLRMTPTRFSDERGFFCEQFNQRTFNECTGLNLQFVQDNLSLSQKHVLRGLHFQYPYAQGKLIQVLRGEIYDVVVDLRPDSNHFGEFLGIALNSETGQQLWIPPGFAHGFYVQSTDALVLYKTTEYYHPPSEYCLHWNDPDLAITWPLTQPPLLSEKDRQGLSWHHIKTWIHSLPNPTA